MKNLHNLVRLLHMTHEFELHFFEATIDTPAPFKVKIKRAAKSIPQAVSPAVGSATKPISIDTPTPSSIPTRMTQCSRRIGRFFHGPRPAGENPPLLSEGDSVRPGQVVGYLKYLQRMDEIKSEKSGRITRVFKADGDSIQYGEPLFEFEGESSGTVRG